MAQTHDGTLKIAPAPIASLVALATTDVEKTYDATPLAAGRAEVSVLGQDAGTSREQAILGQLALEYSVDGQTWTTDAADITATNVGDTMSAAAGNAVQVRVRALTGNFAGALTGTEDVVVTPRHFTLTADSASKAYDGTPLTTNAYELTAGSLVADEGFANVAVDGEQTYAGSSESTIGSYEFARGTLLENYLVAVVAGLLTVTDGSAGEPVDPGKVVVKTHGDGTYGLGDVVEFAIAARNIYDTPRTMTFTELGGVEITGASVFEDVQPGATVSTAARYVVREADVATGSFTNEATVAFAGGVSFEATDDVAVKPAEPPAPAPAPDPEPPAPAPEPAAPAPGPAVEPGLRPLRLPLW